MWTSFTGIYSTVGILAALTERERTRRGCHIDMALLDTASVLSTRPCTILASGEPPQRLGNAPCQHRALLIRRLRWRTATSSSRARRRHRNECVLSLGLHRSAFPAQRRRMALPDQQSEQRPPSAGGRAVM